MLFGIGFLLGWAAGIGFGIWIGVRSVHTRRME